jgi:hypothetical protein
MTTYTYQGNGEYLPGIPARDLTERDVARLSADQVDSLKTKGADGKQLYIVKTSGEPEPAPKPKGKGDATPATD